MARKIALSNQKGGVGKTTTVINVGVGIARQTGKRPLLVDLDPQGNLTNALAGSLEEDQQTVFEVLAGDIQTADGIMQLDEVDLLPADRALAGADTILMNKMARERILKKALAKVEGDYDYILIDCPATLGLLTVNAFVAADEVVIPVECEAFALNGLVDLLETIDEVREALHPGLTIGGVLATKFNKGLSLNKQVQEALQQQFKDNVFETLIRKNVKLAEAPSHCQPIYDYAPGSAGAEDYEALTTEILQRSA
ncbi:ParA family protein (plasmid) [Halodesulfovibrio aestuarii]|uniref:Chromosome partitioning protein n=1 Tax=Halodesulfovibrio aestuarii TaxID=126333 RepID=A0A8G2CC44_9BACT|nr:ParA family protein [Halodesulfovibrio aestuarii]SHJ71722.1 chromosome partitioning protein [Halodesulfovibrio aestuarii]